MDALYFIHERNRMCRSFEGGCGNCPMVGKSCGGYNDADAKHLIETVEKWSKENPIKTRQDVFLEQWPEAQLDDQGTLMLCPLIISSIHRNEYGGCIMGGISCSNCCHEFWSQEVYC